MKTYYLLKNGKIEQSDDQYGNIEIFRGPSNQIRIDYINDYDLPDDVFDFDDMPAVAPRIEIIDNKQLGKVLIFVISNIVDTQSARTVEERLESHTFLLTDNKLFWFMNNGKSTIDEKMLQYKEEEIESLESIIMIVGLLAYKNFTAELNKQKVNIDDLNGLAEKSTSKKVLVELANTEKDMVMLQHTIETQESSFNRLLEEDYFIQNLNNDYLIYDIKWYNRQVNKLVNVYRDLLEATGGLFNDIMSNNLNQLMKFLNSISIILAASGLIASLWGMNTGGLPFKNNEYGTLIMLSISFLAGLSMYIYLNKRDYF